MAAPTTEEQEEFLLSCRYGDLDEVKQFIDQFGAASAAEIRDDNGNTALHMLCGNGHADVLDYLLPIIPPTLLSAGNSAQSTPLHWAALNSHLDIVKKLVQFPGGPGIDLIDNKNAAGRSPLAEAELAGWDEGAQWLVQMMKLDPGGNVKEGEVDDANDPAEGDDAPLAPEDIEIEIEDADGQMAKMRLGAQQ
ncbi:Ankyrin repeat-containing protein P16F5.05c [Mycena sanguinolenta]|uniref:Ankyrin repeat-containing protein P16F5.05c n=1 Tax=Mycena sanguinolenta TaxID=230812 RepID=A0A8H7CWS2_9AGAR|nr:Ankyrin repeat-containing protein P16F5.05c [Mycena sanguinolenta]